MIQKSCLQKELDAAYARLNQALEELEKVKAERDDFQKSTNSPSSVISFWDHSGKPSVFVVKENGSEIYRGPYNHGYEIYCEKRGIKK